MRNIYIKTKLFIGEDALKALETIKNKNIWIICDGFLVKSNGLDKLKSYLNESNKVYVFDEVVPDPPLTVIGKGVAQSKSISPDIVIGYGGGSAIDTAKAIIYFSKAQGLIDIEKFIAIPTTSGTGSEVTSATVVSDTEERRKHIIFDEGILPDEAILDSSLTLSVPPAITANTGIDVLTHAIEAYVAKNSNAYSDALAEKSVELVIDSLITCYFNGDDIKAREKMHEASNLAGIAFNIAGLGINHSLAHQIGGRFHIPHGLANGILLNTVIDFNSEDSEILEKYYKLACKVGMIERNQTHIFGVEVLKKYIKSIMSIMKMPSSLKNCGVSQSDFNESVEMMAENALNDGCTEGNKRSVNKKDLKILLETIY